VPLTLVDNIPVMFSVLTMNPEIYAGVGGSLLSIGSVAGVGMNGQAQDTPSSVTSNRAR
jgi:hypothetical protein